MSTYPPTVTPRWRMPVVLIEQGRPSEVVLELWRGPELVTPSSVTVSILSASGSALVEDGVPITVDGRSVYTVTGPVSEDWTLGVGYRIEWTADGRIYDTEAAVCRRVPSPVVTDADVWAAAPHLDPRRAGSSSSTPTNQGLIDEAWVQIQTELYNRGRRPWLIIDQANLREPHLALSLSMIHRTLASRERSDGPMGQLADRYGHDYRASMGRLSLRYDDDDDGTADRTRSASGTLWLVGTPPRRARGS